MMDKLILSALLSVVLIFGGASVTNAPTTFIATAYVQTGRTASGRPAGTGIVAADPRILPLGTRIAISGAGGLDGIYTVADTGVRGRTIDIWVSSVRTARQFGRRKVQVRRL